MKTGIELIAEERKKQIDVKGYDIDFIKDHPEYYSSNQLSNAALYAVTGEREYQPENWPDDDINSLYEKKGIDALIVAGALIAAEIDRLQGKT